MLEVLDLSLKKAGHHYNVNLTFPCTLLQFITVKGKILWAPFTRNGLLHGYDTTKKFSEIVKSGSDADDQLRKKNFFRVFVFSVNIIDSGTLLLLHTNVILFGTNLAK